MRSFRSSQLAPIWKGQALRACSSSHYVARSAVTASSWLPKAPGPFGEGHANKKNYICSLVRGNVSCNAHSSSSEIGSWIQTLQENRQVRSVHMSSPMLKGELPTEDGDDTDAQCARNARHERGVQKVKAKGGDKRVATTAGEGPAATATYGIIALVVGVFVVAMAANVANGYLRPDGQFWLYHRTLRKLKKDEYLLSIMGGSIRGVHSRRTSNSRVNLLQCANFVDEEGVKRCRLKFYVVPSNTGLDDAGVVFVEYDVSRFFQPTLSYLIVQLLATNEKITLWENGHEVQHGNKRLPLQ